MTHLSVVESKGSQATEEFVNPMERERVLESFEATFDDLKTCSHARASRLTTDQYNSGLATMFSNLVNGEARYLKIIDKNVANHQKEILVLKRIEGDEESILTFFVLQRGLGGVQSAAIFQEIKNEKTGFNGQVDIRCDAGVSGDHFASMLHTSTMNDKYTRLKSRPEGRKHLESCMKGLDTIAHKALDPSVEHAVTHAETEERDRIKMSKRKKSTARAIFATISHLPQHIEQERQAA